MNLKVIEPLKMLFKDEVRKIGTSLKMPQEILSRHPFPGPRSWNKNSWRS